MKLGGLAAENSWGLVAFVLFVVVFGLRCTSLRGVACGFLHLVFALFICCFGCVVVFVRVTSAGSCIA